MQFALTEEQQELASTVRALVARRSASMDLRAAMVSEAGYDVELWRALCEQIGVSALVLPEEYGGAGFTYFETHLVLEELGASLTPSPLLGSGVIATQALLLSGAQEACQRLLPDVAEGRRTLALCWADRRGAWQLDGSDVSGSETDGWTLEGTATLVLDGVDADTLLVVARTPGGVALFEMPGDAPGLVRTATPGVDQTMRFCEVRFEGTPATLLAADFAPSLPRLWSICAVATTALQTGAARRALELTVAYLKERVQFGRPLGSFQALKHRCADMLVQVETARSMSWSAAWHVAHDHASAAEQASLAKSWCSDAFNHVAAEMVQLHGGIAITWEHDAHLYFKRAHATAQLFGRAAEHRRALALDA